MKLVMFPNIPERVEFVNPQVISAGGCIRQALSLLHFP